MGEVGTRAGQEDEDRRAEVSDPAGEEEKRRGFGKVGGLGLGHEEFTAMIEDHQNHDETAKEVDAAQAYSGVARGDSSADVGEVGVCMIRSG